MTRNSDVRRPVETEKIIRKHLDHLGFMRHTAAILCVVLVAFCANVAAQDGKKTEPGV